MKYSFELKEPLPRKLLRYALWTILMLGALALVVNSAQMAQKFLAERTIGQGSANVSPEDALNVAEKLSEVSPSDNTRLRLIRVAAENRRWELADMLMDEYRPATVFKAQALEVMISMREARDNLKEAVEGLRAIPQNDDERILLAQAAVASGDRNLQNLAKRALRQLESELFKNKASLLLARMAVMAGEPQQAKELAARLLEKNLSPNEAVELLKLCEELRMTETNDFRSSLKMAARNSPALTMALVRHFSTTQKLPEITEWMKSLPAQVTGVTDVALELVILQLKANEPEAAAATLQKMGNTRLPEMIMKILMNELPSLSGANAKDLQLYAHFCQATDLPAQRLEALKELNRVEPHLWSLQAAWEAAQATHDDKEIQAAVAGLRAKLPQNALAQMEELYPRLLDMDIEPKADYETLKKISARYSGRNFPQALLALAHYRAGNVTDALLTLPKEPNDAREKLICAVVLAKAGQNTKAGGYLREISPAQLTQGESELYQTTLKQLQEAAPLKQLMDNILKPTEATVSPTPVAP